MVDDDNGNDTLTPDERAALAGHRGDMTPPPGLVDRIVGELQHRDVLRVATPRRAWLKAVGPMAAAAVFAAGVWIGTMVPRSSGAAPTPVPAPTQPQPHSQFMLLLYEDAAFRQGGPEDAQARVREYSAWARTLAASGRLVAGEELAARGEDLRSDGHHAPIAGAALADEPRGYFVIAAPDEAGALEIAATCPHLAHGGRVIVRPIQAH